MTRRASCLATSLAIALTIGPRELAAQSGGSPAIRSPSPEALEVVRSIYEYSRRLPVRVDTVATDSLPRYTRQKLVFNVPLHQSVPALLAVPKGGQRPFPVVILMHGYTAAKDGWFRAEAGIVDPLIQAGIAILALDAPYHGERGGESAYRLPFDGIALRDLVVRWVIEHRRALDYLATRRDLDSTRLGVVGASMGSWSTFALAGVDARVKVAVAAVTPIGGPRNPAMLPAAPYSFTGALAKTPILMLMGRRDQYYSVDDAQKLFDSIAGTSKELIFYDSGHELPVDWIAKATAWLIKHLR